MCVCVCVCVCLRDGYIIGDLVTGEALYRVWRCKSRNVLQSECPKERILRQLGVLVFNYILVLFGEGTPISTCLKSHNSP